MRSSPELDRAVLDMFITVDDILERGTQEEQARMIARAETMFERFSFTIAKLLSMHPANLKFARDIDDIDAIAKDEVMALEWLMNHRGNTLGGTWFEVARLRFVMLRLYHKFLMLEP